MPKSQKIFPAEIEAVKEIAVDTYEVALKISADFSFIAGQYLWLDLGELATGDPRGSRRAFSIASPPSLSPRVKIIFRTGSSIYKKTLINLIPKTPVQIIAPFGCFYPKKNSSALFLAGGVGIAPFLSILMDRVEKGEDILTTLVCANSTSEREIYKEQLESATSNLTNIKAIYLTGPLRFESIARETNLNKYDEIFICGPKEMVSSLTRELTAAGIDIKKIHFEENWGTGDSAFLSQSLEDFLNPFYLAIKSGYNHTIITDENGVILYANEAAEKITGFKFSEMKGNTPRLWGGEMEPDIYPKLWEKMKVDKQPFKNTITNRRKNGEIYQVIATISPILDQTDKLVGFVGYEEDVTERVKTEQELIQTKQFLDSIIDQLPEMFFLKDAKELRFVRINRRAEEILGINKEEMIGKNDYDFFPKDQADAFTSKDKDVLARKQQVLIEEEAIDTKAKGKRFLRTKKIPLLNSNNDPEFLLGLSEDITEQKEAREKLAQKTAELERINRFMVNRELKMVELKNINKLLEEKLHAK